MSRTDVNPEDNPLLGEFDLPPFSRIRSDHAEAALEVILATNRDALARLLENPIEWDWRTLIEPLDALEDRLDKAWAPIRHLNAVCNSEELRSAYNACLTSLSTYYTELGQNQQLFAAYRDLREGAVFPRLTETRRRVVELALQDFELSGVNLPDVPRHRYKELQTRLSALQARFDENVLDATQGWTKIVESEGAVTGLPDSARDLLKRNASNHGQDGWMMTLDFPSYHAVSTYSDNRDLREELYRAYTTRASDQGPDAGRWDNSETMAEILAARQESAELLGYADYATRSLARKMADTPQAVLDFLHELARRARPAAERELMALREYAGQRLGIETFQPWDLLYVSEKLRQDRHSVSQEELKQYFVVDSVLDGLFTLLNRLYKLTVIRRFDIDAWHPDVRFYDIMDEGGGLRGRFYLDLYARKNKRGGAWMDVCQNRKPLADGIRPPVAFLTCNAAPGVEGRPALMTHGEVITLFHEFGHGLHHMLTRVNEPAVAGIHGVEWDAVELPSQFMENWCWERPALDLIARHHETGRPLPDDLYQRLRETRHFNAGLQTLRQLEFALFDFRLHLEYGANPDRDPQELLTEVRDEIAVIRPPDYVRFQHSFGHIFSGGYAAGYYSYKWAEVLSADAFSAFEEEGLMDPAVGRRFLTTILERGGSRPAAALFRDFRHRDPKIGPLLRHSGLQP